MVNRHVKDRIARLQRESGDASITEVVRKALALYELVLETHRDGGKLVIENGGEREVLRIV